MSEYVFITAEDWNAMLRRMEALETANRFFPMQIEPVSGASWVNNPTMAIVLNSNGYYVSMNGLIPPGYKRFRIHIAYTGGDNNNTGWIDYQDSCAGIGDNRISNPWTSPLPECGLYDDYNLETSDWVTINELHTPVISILTWVTGGNGGAFYIIFAQIEADKESS